jgi:transcriptional regulator GlxA family with amidase domain
MRDSLTVVDKATLACEALADMPKNPRFPPKPATVEIVAFPQVQLLDVAGPMQVFATANDYAVRQGRAKPYSLRVVAERHEVTASAGLALAAAPLPSPRAAIDTLIVAGGPGVRDAAADPKLVRWVKARAGHARRVGSVCTGAFLLAASGLLDGRRVATHWTECEHLARRFPKLRVEPDPIFIRDGNVWTSAGVTAGIDLALALVEEDLGRTLALAVARHLVVFRKRPGGQAQFSAALSLQHADDKFGTLHEWMTNHLERDLSLPTLARQANMSERNFSRRYTEITRTTPARAVEKLRVEAARMLLTDTRLPIKRVAQRCGFGSEETMRRSFLRQLSATPQDYRARFSAV